MESLCLHTNQMGVETHCDLGCDVRQGGVDGLRRPGEVRQGGVDGLRRPGEIRQGGVDGLRRLGEVGGVRDGDRPRYLSN